MQPRSVLLLLLLARLTAGAWLRIGEGLAPPTHSTSSSSSPNWVPLEAHRLHPDQGYDPRCLGNLAGAQKIEPPRSVRNHALVAPVAIGTPEQHMSCALDSGSADIWLPSRRCPSCAADREERRGFFSAADSSTFRTMSVMTPFGPSLKMLRIVYGGGSVEGLVANDTVRLASATVADQTFVLAEAGGQDARHQRSWDGICGIGHDRTEHGGVPFHNRLDQAVYTLVPPSTGRSRRPPRLVVGSIPSDLIDTSSIFWVPAAAPDGRTGGLWATNATVSVGDRSAQFQRSHARVVLETGTSFMLVPHRTYLPFIRSLLPEFDQLCGLGTGNTVVCSCKARDHMVGNVVIELKDRRGEVKQLTLHTEDLFEEAPAAPGRAENNTLCVLQVQPSPAGGPDPGHLLGASALRAAPGFLAVTLAGPAKPRRRLDIATTLGSTEPADGATEQLPDKRPGAVAWAPVQPTGPLHEQAVQVLGDGTHCVSEIVKAENGTVVSASTYARVAQGGATQKQTSACNRALLTLLGDRGQLQEHSEEPEVWVLGDILLRRYALLLDFGQNRMGFAEPTASKLTAASQPQHSEVEAESAGAAVEVLVGGPASSAIQTYDSSALGGGLAIERLRTAAAHLLRDSWPEPARSQSVGPPRGVTHLRSAAADLLMVPEPARETPQSRDREGAQTWLPSGAVCAALLGGVVMGSFALRWQLADAARNTGRSRLVGTAEDDPGSPGRWACEAMLQDGDTGGLPVE